jgi:hypothetical protein
MTIKAFRASQLENMRIMERLNNYSPNLIIDFNRLMPVVTGADIYILIWHAGDRTYELELNWDDPYDDFWIRWCRFTNLRAFL